MTELEQDEYTSACEHALTNSMNEIKQRYLKLNTIFLVTLNAATSGKKLMALLLRRLQKIDSEFLSGLSGLVMF
ncbi:hypothetical protein [Lacimicrobium alkaliphilum]|uniref:Uncharacterized protein n=1 Tax=Lacimicrobium alkaliphilum TaxID=1526571 RepID=A0A0U2RI72_9ALTE|nr:hypothetical protein [Lacimicrobium alkaliphilum]ALS96890.1 hypothetical protein AT746_00425 [Lacimicrobium alkaliphilum]